ncbi:MAG: sulfur carrier protein ThiS [Lachnospiraceae bacterium]|nr:sulfur carrier protein ThiS [Lachnospiraceae bacterium]
MVQINGEVQDVAGMKLEDYLKENDYVPDHIAIGWNEEILPKEEYATKFFCDGDIVEIVGFVGGGAA